MSNAHEEEALGKAYDSRLMRRLMEYMRPYKWRVILALALTLAVTPLELAPPKLFQVAIDRYLTPAISETINLAAARRGLVLISLIYLLVLFLIFWRNTYRSASCSASGSKPCTTCGRRFLGISSGCR